MLIATLLIATIFLAYTNGANDNFKGVATLYGSEVLNYKTAITLATATEITRFMFRSPKKVVPVRQKLWKVYYPKMTEL